MRPFFSFSYPLIPINDLNLCYVLLSGWGMREDIKDWYILLPLKIIYCLAASLPSGPYLPAYLSTTPS